MESVKRSRYFFGNGQAVKAEILVGQDLDPGRGCEYKHLCSVPPLRIWLNHEIFIILKKFRLYDSSVLNTKPTSVDL